MDNRSLFLIASLSLVACGGGSSTTTEEGGGGSTSGGGSSATSSSTPEEACLATMRRERECTAEFIPAIVGLRVRLDEPGGIAARDASEGRDALVAEANAEWTTDSTDERFAANCAQMAELPAERAASWTEMMQGCLAAADCAGFVECDVRFTESRMSAQ